MHYVTGGESHGPALTAIVSGVPAGLIISEKQINADLARRQSGYGRGGRQQIERDQVRILSGVRFGRTLGTPVTLQVANRDWENWTDRMAAFGEAPEGLRRETTPRPGHADLLGVIKTDTNDCRDILERASARETAARVAASGIAREFLAAVGVEVYSYVRRIGSIEMCEDGKDFTSLPYNPLDIETSDVRCPDPDATAAMKRAIDRARQQRDTLGGEFRVVVTGLVPGLGGYAERGDRLTARLGAALFSIPAIKGVEFGIGFDVAKRPGSQVHDEIFCAQPGGFSRSTNRAGGLEGGMATGLPLVITAAMKPIPTLMQPLKTVDIDTLESTEASKERSDVCAVPAAAVVAEAEVAFVLADAYLEKFGRDNMTDIRAALKAYRDRVKTMSR